MSCRRFEKLIALFVEGDLPDRRVRNVERHLADCAQCRVFAEELKESQAGVRALGREAVPQDALEAVRKSVMGKVAGTRVVSATARQVSPFAARFNQVTISFCVAALLIAASVAFLWREGAGGPDSTRSEHTQATALPIDNTDSPIHSQTQAEGVEPQGAGTSGSEFSQSEPLVIKLMTDDPNIIIILLANGEEDENVGTTV